MDRRLLPGIRCLPLTTSTVQWIYAMKKTVGNVEVEVHEATNCGDPYLVYLSVRTSTIKVLNLSPDDAQDLIYGLQWALGLRQPDSASCSPSEGSE